LNAFLASNKIRKSKDQDQHLHDVFQDIPLDKLPSVFKMSLAQYFSIKMKQELPDIDGISVNLFSENQERIICYKLRRLDEVQKVKILFTLLQCKDLANKVPESMILEAYKKHRGILSTVRKTPEDILQFVRQYARQFANSVANHYRNSIPLALTTAPYESTRSQGGTRSFLSDRLIFNKSRRIQTETRIDPVVIHFVGKPGLGKSYLSEHLIGKLANQFQISKEDARYSRSMATEHWDGYRNQLISQIDDIFTSRDSTDDCKQIIQMCSNAKWVIPMADLREKGREFNSEFLILSSNNRGQRNMYVNNDQAIDRRIYKPFFRLIDYDRFTKIYTIHKSVYEYQSTGPTSGSDIFQSEKCIEILKGDCDFIVNKIMNYCMETYNQRLDSLELIDQKSYKKTYMPIVTGNSFEFKAGYEFDPCPKTMPIVKAHAIPEPLKVRMITKGEAQNWVLKPLQKAMHRALKDFPCFRLTSGQCILNNFKKFKEGMLYVSGDYSAATDNLNMDIMETVVSELIKVLPSEIIPYVIRESSAHIIEYPTKTGLDSILQTNGQLMGSLLSFPILCVANAATYGMASNIDDMIDLKCLINGDDISFRDFQKVIRKWKIIANQMGLIPSVGKNYVSRKWFTINSQLCYSSQNSNMIKVLPSSAYNTIWSHRARRGEINTIREAVQRFDKRLVVSNLKSALKMTPRSIDISVHHGGLGIKDTRQPTKVDREINLMSFLNKKTQLVKHIDEYSIVQCTKEIALKYVNLDLIRSSLIEGQYPPKRALVSYDQVMPNYKDILQDCDRDNLLDEWKAYKNFVKFYKGVPCLRDWINSDKKLFNLKNSKVMTIIVSREIYEQMPPHSLIDVLQD